MFVVHTQAKVKNNDIEYVTIKLFLRNKEVKCMQFKV